MPSSKLLDAVSTTLEERLVGKDLGKIMADALQKELTELCKYESAHVGGRTIMMDALIPFMETLSKSNDLEMAVEAASEGAERTRRMDSLFGRASYISKEQFAVETDGIPDPGVLEIVALFNVKGYCF